MTLVNKVSNVNEKLDLELKQRKKNCSEVSYKTLFLSILTGKKLPQIKLSQLQKA